MSDVKYKIAGTAIGFSTDGGLPANLERSGRFEIDRMKSALATNSVKVPSGLTREELRAFILEHAKNSK